MNDLNRNKKRERVKAQAANAGRRHAKRAGKKTLHYMLFLLLCVTAGAVLSLTVFFKIQAINIIGTDKYDPVEIRNASGIVIGENLFRFSKKDVIANILREYPYIGSVEVDLRIPSTVDLVLTQCVPAGAVKEEDEYALITRDGKILERGVLYIREDIPLIKGIRTNGAAPGQYIGEWEKRPIGENETPEQEESRKKTDRENEMKANAIKESLIMIEYLFDAIDKIGFEDITNVDITDRLNMKIMYDNRLLFELGSEADLVYKLELIRVIIKDKLKPDARGVLHAENAKTKKVVFTPAEDYDMEEKMIADDLESSQGAWDNAETEPES